MIVTEKQPSLEIRDFWDREANTFDCEPDHGLLDPQVYAAWERLLSHYVPSAPSGILDIGCGTGSISVLLSRLGQDVTGADLSPAMVELAQAKAKWAALSIDFLVMDASVPAFAPGRFDVIVCRHILWALPEPAQVLRSWADLLASPGRLVLIEGYWHTGGGMHSAQIVEALPSSACAIHVEDLSSRPALWGGDVSDQRYLVSADFA